MRLEFLIPYGIGDLTFYKYEARMHAYNNSKLLFFNVLKKLLYNYFLQNIQIS